MGAGKAALAFLAYAGGQLAAGLLAGIAGGVWYSFLHGSARTAEWMKGLMAALIVPAGAFSLVVAGALVFWIARYAYPGELRAGAFAPLGVRSTQPAHLAIAALAGVLLALLHRYGVVAAWPMPAAYLDAPIFRAVAGGGFALYLWIVAALVLAPVIEEFVYRGVLFAGFRRSWGVLPAGIVVTLLFLVMHVGDAATYPPSMIALGALAIATLAARVLSDSIAPGIAMHAAYNSVILLTIFGPLAPR